MSEARAQIPQDPASQAMGMGPLRSGLPQPSGDVVLPSPAQSGGSRVPPRLQNLPGSEDQNPSGGSGGAGGATPQGGASAAPQPGINPQDPLAPVMERIARGESGGNPDPYTALYGGGNFGWQGIPNTGSGKYGFVKSTWDRAVKEYMAHGGAQPDFNNHADQDSVSRFWAMRTYAKNTGRSLIDDAKAGQVNYAALAGEWPSLAPHTLRGMLTTPVSGGGAGMAGLAQSEQEISQLSERDRKEYERIQNAPDPNAKERSELLTDARERARESREAYANLSSNPPSDKPIGALENFGSFGTMLALLIGGMGRHHMNGALGAAGAMMQAAQANNHELFERQYKIWDHQTTSALNLAHLEREEIRDLLEDKRMSENERQARLHSFFEEHQMGFQAAQAKAGLWEHVYTAEQAAKRAQEGLKAQQYYFAQGIAANEIRQLDPNDPDYEKKSQDILLKRGLAGDTQARIAAGGGSGGQLNVSKPFDVVDDKGNVVREVMAREGRGHAGFVDSETGEPIKLEPGEHLKQVTPTTTGGGRAGAQVLRQQIGGREVLSDLQNAVSLPVGTTIGALGTVHTGPSVMGALHGDLVRVLTDQDSQLMQASMASMTRELSILMSPVYGGNWAAQQIDPLVPKSGDTLGTVMFKLARLAQSADNALEAVSKSPILSNVQKEYSLDLSKQIKDAIPWSPKQAMDFARKGDKAQESFGDFVKAGKLEGGKTSAPAGTPPPPAPGDLMDGHIFKGGDPADPKNWTKAPPGAAETR